MDRRVLDSPFVWLLAGALVGSVLGASTQDPFFLILLTAVGAAIGVIGFLSYTSGRPYTKSAVSAARPATVFARVRDRFGRAPWVLARNDEIELVYWRRLNPDLLLTVILLLLGVFPALVYVLMSIRRTQTIVILAIPTDDGTTIHGFVMPSGSNGQRIIDRLLANLCAETD